MPSKYQRKKDIISDEDLLKEPPITMTNDRMEKIFSQETPTSSSIQFDVQEAPSGIFDVKKETNYLDSILNKIGITPNETSPTEKIKEEYLHPTNLNLTAKQEKWCEEATGFAVYLFGGLCSLWEIFGEEYNALKPTMEMKMKIVAPLVRIYARTIKKLDIINPNHVDMIASMTALIGYGVMCYQNIRLIHAYKNGELEDYELRSDSNGSQRGNDTGNDTGANRPRSSTAESKRTSTSSRTANSTSTDDKDVGRERGYRVDPGKLTPEQQFQRDRLAQLTKLDIETRARQFGINGSL